MKRALDATAAGVGLIATAPVMAGVAGAVAVTMGRPVLFTQDRVGENERVFRIYKFRSMREPRTPDEPDADRITRLGRFLRSSSLDELPQLLNVLKGDMSLVGPRPLLIRYLDRYSPRQRLRHAMPPGITGWAQVSGRNTLSWDDKFAHDVWYVENWSFLLDLRILAKTAAKVVVPTDISADGHATMPEFMGPSTGEAAGTG